MAKEFWNRRVRTITSSVLLMSAMVTAQAQPAYPSKPLRMIAPSSPGGPVDLIARAVGQGLGDAIGQQVVIENRAGAAGLIGAELVAKAPPDGYTLLFGFSGPLAIVPNLNDAIPYNPLTDFAPVSMVAAADYILLAHPSVPAKTVKELVALAKARPGRMHFASGGTGTGIHMAGELFKHLAGVQIVHVPYKGAAPALIDVQSGQIQVYFGNLPVTLPHAKAGKLRALGVTSAKRAAVAPEVPTVAEAGLPGFELTPWYGVMTRAGTPDAILGKLNQEIVRILRTPEMRERVTNLGAEPSGLGRDEFASFLRSEAVKWGKLVKASGAKAE